jgi:hypothetical protein
LGPDSAYAAKHGRCPLVIAPGIGRSSYFSICLDQLPYMFSLKVYITYTYIYTIIYT